MKIAEAREQKVATVRKNLKLLVVALLVLAIEKTIDMVASFFTDNDNCSCVKTNMTIE